MCKYCEEEFIYHDSDFGHYLLEYCPKCDMDTFKEIEDERCGNVESYSIIKYMNSCEMEYGLTTLCKCDS